MIHKLESKREVNKLTLLLAATYMVSYITRTNFGAIVSEISHATGFSKSLLSMPLTGSFVTYGLGQLLSGVLGDRISPKKLVSLGLVVTVAMNALIPLCSSPWMMMGVWCVNGLAQAFMWPPIVRMMTTLLTAEDYKKTATQVSCAGPAGTILIYLLAPVIIAVMNWRATFYFSAIVGVIMLILWNTMAKDIQSGARKCAKSAQRGSIGLILSPLVLSVLFLIILQGMLRDGITTWMPSFISESFHLGNEISILSGVLLPIFSIACIQFTNWLYRKKLTNPLVCSGVLFGAGAVFAFALYLCCGNNVVFSVLFSAALTGCINGVNLLLIGMVPQYFERFGNVSTMSGILNSCTYIGSALSTYGFAALSEGIGWSNTIFLWFAIALAGCIICLVCIRPWKRKFETAD